MIHGSHERREIRVATITVSDTRTEADDEGGRKLRELLEAAGFVLAPHTIVKDDPDELRRAIERCAIDTTDAIVLIAAGDVTIGIDLTKLEDQDFSVDHETGAAHLMLPPPEVLSVRLDEEHTYVYRRATALLAQRNEHLESKARQEAIKAIDEAARDGAVMEKARKQAERQVRDLLSKLGVANLTVGWRPS